MRIGLKIEMEERMGETAGESMKMGMEKAMSENTAVSRGNPRRKEESDAKRKPVIGQRELGGCPTQGTQNPGGGRAVCCAAAACQRGAKHAACRAPGGYTAAGQARADGFRTRDDATRRRRGNGRKGVPGHQSGDTADHETKNRKRCCEPRLC